MRGHINYQPNVFVRINLEELVPTDHPLRAIKRLADEALASMSRTFAAAYAPVAKGGRPSIPPERLLKALVLMSLYTLRSERALCERISFDMLFRWFLDMTPDEPCFNHSVFSVNRQRLDRLDVTKKFSDKIVLMAFEAGLVAGARAPCRTGVQQNAMLSVAGCRHIFVIFIHGPVAVGNHLDGDECPPWHMAVLNDRLDGSHPPYRIKQLRCLLALGADPDIRNCRGCCLDEELSADQLEELSRDIGKARARLQGMDSESAIADRSRLPDTPGGRIVLGALALPIAGAAVWAYALTFDYAPLVKSVTKDVIVALMRAVIFMCFSVSVLGLAWAACTPRWLRARLERDTRRAAQVICYASIGAGMCGIILRLIALVM